MLTLINIKCFGYNKKSVIFVYQLKTIVVMKKFDISLSKRGLYFRYKCCSVWVGWLSFSKNDCFIPRVYTNTHVNWK